MLELIILSGEVEWLTGTLGKSSLLRPVIGLLYPYLGSLEENLRFITDDIGVLGLELAPKNTEVFL